MMVFSISIHGVNSFNAHFPFSIFFVCSCVLYLVFFFFFNFFFALDSFMSTWEKLNSSERRKPELRNTSIRSAIGKPVGHFLHYFLKGKVQPIMGGATCGQVVLGSIRSRLSKLWEVSQWAASISGLCITSCLQVPDVHEFLHAMLLTLISHEELWVK